MEAKQVELDMKSKALRGTFSGDVTIFMYCLDGGMGYIGITGVGSN